MSKETKDNMVPKLRFPEFETEWKEKLVENFFDVGSSKRVLEKDWTDQGIPFYRTRELVSLSNNEPFRNEIFISEELFSELSQKYGLPAEGDFLVSGVGTLGISYQVKKDDKFYFKDGNVLWLRIKPGIVSSFFKYCFQSDIIQKQIFGQASISTVGTYTIQNAKNTRFCYPTNIDEQQKIASCLSSLDDLITAENQKLEALKAHKKGLMQQLFPAEGKKVPELRFEEFKESGEWEEKTLGEVAEIKRGASSQYLNYSAENSNTVRLLRINDFLGNDAVFVDDTTDMRKFRVQTGDLLIAGTGATAGITFIVPEEFDDFAYSYNAPRIRIRKENVYFIYSYLKTDLILLQQKKSFVGNAQPFLDTKAIANLRLKLPNLKEQQKIADCLSSLDELITSQGEKIEVLKEHKRGLMQGLFPVSN
ncbi:MAG: restriction endonuclease subunit S [Ginsengibacter sp.]